MDLSNLFNCSNEKGICALTKCFIIFVALSPGRSCGLNTLKPSLVSPPLAIKSVTASVQIDSDINGCANSFIDINVPARKSSMIPSSSVLPSATALITVCTGLTSVSYALA